MINFFGANSKLHLLKIFVIFGLAGSLSVILSEPLLQLVSIENYITNSHYKWADDVVAGPVLGDTLVVYVDNSRVKKIVQLEEQSLIVNIEKNTKISLKNIDIQISNLKQ